MKILKILIIVNLLYIASIFLTRSSYLDRPIIVLSLLLGVYWYKKGKLKIILKNKTILSILFFAFLVRFLGIFFPEHYGLTEQEIYTIPIYAVYSGDWFAAFNLFTSFETFGLFLQTVFFYLTTYFDFRIFISLFHFLFPEHYFFLNIPSLWSTTWATWSPDETYSGLSRVLIDRYALNYFLIRLVIVIFGSATVGVVYLTAKKLYGKTAGIMAAAFLSVTFIHVVMSMMGRMYVISAFFTSLTVLFCLSLIDHGSKKYYLLVGIFLGLTNSIKVFPALVIPVFFAVIFTLFKRRQLNQTPAKGFFNIIINIFLVGIGVVGSFILTSPTLFLYPEHYLNMVSSVFSIVTGSRVWGLNYYLSSVGLPNYLWWMKLLLETGLTLPFFVIMLLGFIYLIYRCLFYRKSGDWILLFSVAPYYFVLINSPTRREEFITFIIPFFTILGSLGLNLLMETIRKISQKSVRKRIIILLMISVFAIPVIKNILFIYSINTADNRTKASSWINKHAHLNSYLYVIGVYPGKLHLNSNSYLMGKEDNLAQDINFYRATGVEYFITYAIRDLTPFVYHPSQYQLILNNLNLLKNSTKEAELYKPFFKDGYFSSIMTLGDLVNEHFDMPLEIYKINQSKTPVSYKIDSLFLNSQRSLVPIEVENFDLIDDITMEGQKLYKSTSPNAKIRIVLKFGRGEYDIAFRWKSGLCKTKENLVLFKFYEIGNEKEKNTRYLSCNNNQDNQIFTYLFNLDSGKETVIEINSLSKTNIFFDSLTLVKK